MRNNTEETLTESVLATLANAPDARFKALMTSFVKHLHGFIRDTELTEAEWFALIQFLTETGRINDDKRNEFIIFSDILGASMLVDAINNRKPSGATPSTVLGPFHVENSPDLANGARIGRGAIDGKPCVIRGRVLTPEGRPIAGALLDVWETNGDGAYDSVDPGQPKPNLRGKFRSDGEGRYWFVGVVPVSYQVPSDGTAGVMLRKLARHPWRPAHVHAIVSAPGYERVVTHVFVNGDPYLDSDAVFGTKDPLIADFKKNDSPAEAAKYGVSVPFYTVDFDFGLKPAAAARAA